MDIFEKNVFFPPGSLGCEKDLPGKNSTMTGIKRIHRKETECFSIGAVK
jgi:hypothetical protein